MPLSGYIKMQSLTSRKVVLIGNAESGKTRAMRELLGVNTPNNVYRPTLGVEVKSIKAGNTIYTVWDTAGNGKFGGLREGYYVKTNIFVVFPGGDANSHGVKTPAEWAALALSVSPDATIHYLSNATGSSLDSILK